MLKFDSTLNLFRGHAVYGDSKSVYDDYYTKAIEPMSQTKGEIYKLVLKASINRL
jgi:hypothetical protein